MSDKDKVIKRLVGKPRCPKCKAEIGCLTNHVSGDKYYTLDDNGNYDEDGFQSNNKVDNYECPECSEVLFTDEDKALNFLKGRDRE